MAFILVSIYDEFIHTGIYLLMKKTKGIITGAKIDKTYVKTLALK